MRRRDWVETEGTVASVTTTYPRGRVQYTVIFTYNVDGQDYEGTMFTFKAWREGNPILVRYDPESPQRNAFEVAQTRKYRTAIVIGVAFVVFLAVVYLVMR
jgi:hypothetical protein